MPGFHVTQRLLRAEVNEVTQRFCEAELSIGRGEKVILYCTSTAAQQPHQWTVFLCADGLAVIGSQGYVPYGTMVQAAFDFYGIIIEEELLFYPFTSCRSPSFGISIRTWPGGRTASASVPITRTTTGTLTSITRRGQ